MDLWKINQTNFGGSKPTGLVVGLVAITLVQDLFDLVCSCVWFLLVAICYFMISKSKSNILDIVIML